MVLITKESYVRVEYRFTLLQWNKRRKFSIDRT